MSDLRGIIGIRTLVVASMASILPLLNEGQGLPAVDFSTVTIQFSGNSLQEFYDCLCGDNIQECIMHYNNIFVRNVVGRSEPDMLSPIPREVTFGCNRPFNFFGGSRKYSCRLQPANDTSACWCAANCPVSHINEIHIFLCRDQCVSIIWNSCHVEYEDFVNNDAPILNSCPRPTPPTPLPVTTNGNHFTSQRRSVATDGNPVTSQGRSVATDGNPVASQGRSFATDGNPVTTQGNSFATDENPVLSENVEPDSESTTQPQTLAKAIGVSGGILVILNVSAIIVFFYWRSKKGKTNLEPARVNQFHGTSDYSVLDAGNNVIGNRPPEHIYNNVSSISGRVENQAENDIVLYPQYSEIEEIRGVQNEPENSTNTGQYSQYSEISNIRTVENENNINLGQHSLYSEPVDSRAVGNEPENNIDNGQLSLYSEPVDSRAVKNKPENNINNGQLSLYSEPVDSRAVKNKPEINIDTGQLLLYSEPVERSEVNTAQSNEYATIA